MEILCQFVGVDLANWTETGLIWVIGKCCPLVSISSFKHYSLRVYLPFPR